MSKVDFSDPATIAFLVAALETAGVDGIEIDQTARKLRIMVEKGIRPSRGPLEAPIPYSAAKAIVSVKSPIAGHFWHQHPPRLTAPSADPATVAAGDIFGFIRIGPVLVPVKATHAGVLTRRFAENGAVVGFAECLFEIECHS